MEKIRTLSFKWLLVLNADLNLMQLQRLFKLDIEISNYEELQHNF